MRATIKTVREMPLQQLMMKQANKKFETKINKEGFKFTKLADILDKIDVNDTFNSFVTLKERKENFMNHPTRRLINPSRNETGSVS